MVGRLIEQKHVGLGEQQSAERHTAFFATRQRAHLGVPRRQAQRVSSNFHLGFHVICPTGGCRGDDRLELSLLGRELVKISIWLSIGRVDLIQALTRLHDSSKTFLDRLAHRVLRIELGLLRQVTDVQAGHRHRFALDLLVHTGHDLEQGGLA